MATLSPVYVFKNARRGTQNIQNHCHQWISDIFRVHQIRFRWGSVPANDGGAYSAPPDRLAGLKGPTFKAEKGRGKEKRRTEERKERKEEGLTQIPVSATACVRKRVTSAHYSVYGN